MLIHWRVTSPSLNSLIPIYTKSKVSYPRTYTMHCFQIQAQYLKKYYLLLSSIYILGCLALSSNSLLFLYSSYDTLPFIFQCLSLLLLLFAFFCDVYVWVCVSDLNYPKQIDVVKHFIFVEQPRSCKNLELHGAKRKLITMQPCSDVLCSCKSVDRVVPLKWHRSEIFVSSFIHPIYSFNRA